MGRIWPLIQRVWSHCVPAVFADNRPADWTGWDQESTYFTMMTEPVEVSLHNVR